MEYQPCTVLNFHQLQEYFIVIIWICVLKGFLQTEKQESNCSSIIEYQCFSQKNNSMAIFICSGCHSKMSQNGWLMQQKLISHHCKGWEVQGHGVDRVSFTLRSSLSLQAATVSLCAHMKFFVCVQRNGQRELSGVPSYKDLNPIRLSDQSSTLMTSFNQLLPSKSTNMATLRINGFNIQILGETQTFHNDGPPKYKREKSQLKNVLDLKFKLVSYRTVSRAELS